MRKEKEGKRKDQQIRKENPLYKEIEEIYLTLSVSRLHIDGEKEMQVFGGTIVVRCLRFKLKRCRRNKKLRGADAIWRRNAHVLYSKRVQ